MKCKILYQKDYLNLLMKYGLEPPSQAIEEVPAGTPSEELGLLESRSA